MPRAAALVGIVVALLATLSAQSPRAEFDVVSIKRSQENAVGGGMRTLPDGTSIMTNVSIRQFIMSASPVPAREVRGLPEWAERERYDATAKPPADSTREQRSEMWRSLFADRMQLLAHVEEAERDTFALVVARSDGRLGPQLKKSALDCSTRPAGAPPPAPPPFDPESAATRCGGLFGRGMIVSGGMRLDALVGSLAGLAGRLVNNRTGLEGDYAFTLKFSTPQPAGATTDAPLPDDMPDFFTALEEQLGLKLQPEKTMVPVFVIDRIERPTEN